LNKNLKLACAECDTIIVNGRCPKCNYPPSIQDTYLVMDDPQIRIAELERENEEMRDAILDALDVESGWCSPKMRRNWNSLRDILESAL
jgi:RNA polymerase subunit RPABC4/transcription elongation factor Spt4